MPSSAGTKREQIWYVRCGECNHIQMLSDNVIEFCSPHSDPKCESCGSVKLWLHMKLERTQ